MDVNIVGDATFIGGKFVIMGYKRFFSTSPWNYFLVENTKNMAFHKWHKWTCIAICMCFLCLKENICKIFKMPK